MKRSPRTRTLQWLSIAAWLFVGVVCILWWQMYRLHFYIYWKMDKFCCSHQKPSVMPCSGTTNPLDRKE